MSKLDITQLMGILNLQQIYEGDLQNPHFGDIYQPLVSTGSPIFHWKKAIKSLVSYRCSMMFPSIQ